MTTALKLSAFFSPICDWVKIIQVHRATLVLPSKFEINWRLISWMRRVSFMAFGYLGPCKFIIKSKKYSCSYYSDPSIRIVCQIFVLTHAVHLLWTVSFITIFSIFRWYGFSASSCSNTLISRANSRCTTTPTGPTGPPAVHFRATKIQRKTEQSAKKLFPR